MDKTKYRLDGHMSKESSLKILDVYLEKEPRKSCFPQCVSYGQTDGHFKFYSSFATNNQDNFFSFRKTAITIG